MISSKKAVFAAIRDIIFTDKGSHKNADGFSFLSLVGSEISVKTAFSPDYIGKKQFL